MYTTFYSYMCIVIYNIQYFRSLMDTLVIVKRSMKSQSVTLSHKKRVMKDAKFVKPQYHPLSLNVHTASPTPRKVLLYVAVSLFMFGAKLLILLPASNNDFTSLFQVTKIFRDRKSLETLIKYLLIQIWLISKIVVR